MNLEDRVSELEEKVKEMQRQLELRPVPVNQVPNPYLLALTNHGAFGTQTQSASFGWPFS